MKKFKIKKIKNKKAISHFDFLFGNKNLLKSKRSNSRPDFLIINNNLLKSKRSQIGSTLTWFVAFIVVVFVMLLFIGATIILSRLKGIDVDKPIKYNSETSESQRVLINIFNEKIEYNKQQITFKELFIKWPQAEKEEKNKIKEKIKKEVEGKLDALLEKDDGYIFYIAFSEKNKEIKDSIYGGGFVQIDGADDYISLSKNFSMYGAAVEARSALERAPTLYFMLDKKVKIKLYIGKTK